MRVTLNEQSQSLWQSQGLEHLRYEYDLSPDDVVIDIGAYQGEWAEQIFCRYGCKLIVVEPGPWIVGFEHGEVINKAADNCDGILRFGGAYYYTSAFEDPTHEYECFDVNSLLRRFDEIALVKMNIEGGEYALLNHIIDAKLHQRIGNLQVQFHLIEDEPTEEMYDAIASKLKKTHHLSFYYPHCWENWQRGA